VNGADRLSLRLDGRIFKNGVLFSSSLPFSFSSPNTDFWTSLSVTPTTVLALRENGQLGVNGLPAFNFAREGFRFLDVLGLGTNIYTLRTDGKVLENQTNAIKFQFDGPEFPSGSGAADGEIFDTEWFVQAIDPVSGDLFALRRDGKVFKGDLPSGAPAGIPVGALPEPNDFPLDDRQRYFDLEFASDGTWYALRGDGKVFASTNLNVPVVDLPGDASDPGGDDTYVDLATNGTDFWALRFDGKIFKNTNTTETVDLTNDRYRRIAVSTTPPDLSNFVNAAPVAAPYTVTALAGDPVSIPVVATDSDKRSADLVVTLDPVQPTDFPPGFSFVADLGATSVRGALVGTAPAEKGGYSIRLFVDDGVNEPKKLTYKLKVILPDTDPLKDKKPVFAKPKKPQVVVTGAPPAEVFELPIGAVDGDGDPITLSVDPKTPLPAGAIFDPGTGFFTWVADPAQAGKTKIKFLATAGTKTVNLKVEFTVVNGLIF
jgi:putative Ig domain-containing protein